MNSKQRILQRVRDHQPPAVDLPRLEGDWTTYPDLRQQFTTALEGVGSQLLVATDRHQADHLVRQLAVCQTASRCGSLAPGIGPSQVDLNAIDAARTWADLDVTIAEGAFAVAENGAIWVSGQAVPQRAALFICQHLVLVLAADKILHNMHQAYERLIAASDSGPNEFMAAEFGVFISGPSKTADIEQSLVIGAQGPRSLCVILIESP